VKVLLALLATVVGTAGIGGKAPPRADLAVTLKGAADAVGVGKTISYTVRVRNAGPARATGVRVTAALPAGMELVSVTGKGCANAGSRAACKVGSLRRGTTTTVEFEAKATAVGAATVTATVSAKTVDPRRRNNASKQTTTVAGHDTVQGHGVRPVFGPAGQAGFRVSVDVDALSDFNGEDASGTFATSYPNGNPELRGRVVCLTVAGNRAMVGGIVESASGEGSSANPPGSGVLFAITDNGEPGAGRDTEVSYIGVENANSCALQDNGQELLLTDGNFTVHDEQP